MTHKPQIHLPPMNGEQASVLLELLELIVSSIWELHGDDLEFQKIFFRNCPEIPYPDDDNLYEDDQEKLDF